MATTYTLIDKGEVGSGGSSAITFTSIPSTYTDLKLVFTGRITANSGIDATALNMKINNVGTDRSWRNLEAFGTGSGVNSYNNTNDQIAAIGGGTGQTANTFCNLEIYFANYANANYKSYSIDFVNETNSSTKELILHAGLWSSTSAINELSIYSSGQTLAEYSTAYLYGIKNS
jgi:hypothetical protein